MTGSGSGSVTVDPGGITWIDNSGTASYWIGTVVTLTAIANSGSIFTEWTGACTGKGTCQVTMDTVKSVGATFINPAAAIWLLCQ